MTSALSIEPPRLSRLDGRVCFEVAVGPVGGRRFAFGHRYPVEVAPARPDATCLVPALLLPAMHAGCDLRFAAPVSARLLAALPTIEDIYRSWVPALERVGVTAGERESAKRPATGRTAAFFSGGVDSFYSLLGHREEIDEVLFVVGVDLLPEQRELVERCRGRVATAAAELGKPMVDIETNLRHFGETFVPWKLYYGAVLASIALGLEERFGRILVASSNSFAHLHPNGSHPLLDPLWSTEALTLVHDGCEATREEKIAAIAAEPIVRRTLRVCWENRGGAFNCGACEKCLRTLAALAVVGPLAPFATFPGGLDLSALAAHRIVGDRERRRFEQCLAFCRERGGSRRIVSALEQSIRRASSRSARRIAGEPAGKAGRWARQAVRRLGRLGGSARGGAEPPGDVKRAMPRSHAERLFEDW